jgi:hypothetical protein
MAAAAQQQQQQQVLGYVVRHQQDEGRLCEINVADWYKADKPYTAEAAAAAAAVAATYMTIADYLHAGTAAASWPVLTCTQQEQP